MNPLTLADLTSRVVAPAPAVAAPAASPVGQAMAIIRQFNPAQLKQLAAEVQSAMSVFDSFTGGAAPARDPTPAHRVYAPCTVCGTHMTAEMFERTARTR